MAGTQFEHFHFSTYCLIFLLCIR